MRPIYLLAAILSVAVVWSAWWGIGAWQTKSALVGWMEDRREEGWQADWSDVTLVGFPNRFDRTIHDLSLADPETGWAWEAPFLQILGLSYRRDHLIVIWPEEQVFATPTQKMVLTGEELRASLTMSENDDEALDHANLVFRDLRLRSDDGWELAAEEARLATRKTAGRAGWVDIGFEAIGFRPPAGFVDTLSRVDVAPDRFEQMRADIAIRLDRPLELSELEQALPRAEEIEIRDVSATWGALDLSLEGRVQVDRSGRAKGEIEVTARGWRQMLRAGREAGLLPSSLVDPLEQGLRLLSGLGGGDETVEVPLTFRDGRTWLGPVPLGPAPQLARP